MKRGELYRVYRGLKYDPKNYRVVLIVSRQKVVDNNFSTVICAPVYSKYDGLSTQVEVGVNEGLKHDSAVYCDEVYSVDKTLLTDFISTLSESKIREVNTALRIALNIE